MLGQASRLHEVAVSPDPSALVPLFRELGHLKRITSAGRQGSIATRLFRRAWGALVADADPQLVTRITVAEAVAAARLGDLDRTKLRELGLTNDQAASVLRASFDAVANDVDARLAASLRQALGETLPQADVPAFVELLAEQPRAGVTCPGKPRLMLQPAENHAEHSVVVAITGVLLAPLHGANPVRVFLAGLGHHFHNAAMPDSGFTGEVMLGTLLDGVIARSRAAAVAELTPDLQALFEWALQPIASDAEADGRAFHAADVIDRVLEIEQHVAAREITMDMVLRDYELVHDGPVKGFHDQTLRDAGLM